MTIEEINNLADQLCEKLKIKNFTDMRTIFQMIYENGYNRGYRNGYQEANSASLAWIN